MHTLRLFSAATLAAFFSIVGAFAQDMPPAKDMVLGKKVFFAFGKKVRDELKVTDVQFLKMQDAFEGGLQVEGDRIMVSVHGDADMATMEKAAYAVLDEGQKKRLDEVWVQMMGAIAAADESVAKALGITPEQSKSLDRILEETARQLQTLFMEEHSEETPKAVRAIRMKASEKALAVLTDPQKATFEKLKGKPFKFEPDKSGG